MTNKKKILILIILAVFCIGMAVETVDAVKTVKCGKYKVKLTNNDLKKIKNGDVVWKKTGRYYNYKKPIYKTKNVKSKKWVYKHVLTGEDYWDDEWNDLTVYDYPENENYYWNHGYKWYGSYYKTYDDGHHVEYYSKFKKKVPFVKKKKVKTGKYKKVKVPIYMVISKNFQDGWGYCMDVKTKKMRYIMDLIKL